ncbi:MAG: hypothetical protein LBN39_08240, partial [Planctomycetaceae bacterium]|nr:hypothetical protein [Planctomycetaceae bacterium]
MYSRTIQCRVCGFAFQTANAGGTASCLVCGEESKPEPEIKETPKTSVPCPPSPACVEQCRAAHCLRYRNGQPCEHLCSPDKAKPDDKVAGSLPFVP